MKKGLGTLLPGYQKLLHGVLDSIKKTLWFLARYAFLFTLLLVLLAIVFGEFLFYNYVLLVEIKDLHVESQVTKFKKEIYESVVQKRKNRENIFNNPSESQYQNPF